MLRQYELVERVMAYDPDADEAMLNRAYVYTVQKHGSQKRASGDPYFSHPVEVAGLMTELRLDQETIITALLHDTLEDTLATSDEIERLFGPDVARLVDGVTKLTNLQLSSTETKQSENFRKLFMAMSKDLRSALGLDDVDQTLLAALIEDGRLANNRLAARWPSLSSARSPCMRGRISIRRSRGSLVMRRS